ncbi:MAG: DUF3160 domain-containing protein [Patescibacteria group bacterium]
MFSEQPTVLSSEQEQEYVEPNFPMKKPIKKIILTISLILAIVVFVLAVFFGFKKYISNRQQRPVVAENKVEENIQIILPNLEVPQEASSTSATTTISDLAVEYLSFTEFYQPPNNNFTVSLDNYDLPLNIKLDGMNYYDLSRKLNLESGISDLNSRGFTIINNPWQNEITDFYSIYARLEEKQIPFLITSDFITYYYQNMTKKVFKDIEANIFYDNLWLINKELYTLAKNRYESRLAAIGEVNDSILEGQRLEMAFFAVSLELLKPTPDQVSSTAIDNISKFNDVDVEKFHLTVPPYLKDDVAREVALIKAGKGNVKSPNLLYQRNYAEFIVPKEYKEDAKLNNFYLAAKWLNSVFPLEYKSDACPDCLLDKEDWRLSMIASSFIATDFSSRPDLKNRWARIYKLMSFFKGLRDELDYIDYRDSLVKVFGKEYNIENIFDDKNKEAKNNLEKLKADLEKYEYSPIRGAINKTDKNMKKLIGFKMLTESYWPNEYLFDSLTSPAVGSYQGTSTKVNDITACEIKKVVSRCNGFSLDIANLVEPMEGNTFFEKNTQYANYKQVSTKLIEQLNRDGLWHTSNYWSTFSLMETILKTDPEKVPVFAKSEEWKQKNLKTAISAWISLQLPVDKFSLTPVFKGQSLNNYSRYNENVYIEPNLPLVNELIATNNMLAQMFTALRLNEELNLASQNIQSIDSDLKILRDIIKKELVSEPLNEKDSEAITDFARKFSINQKEEKTKILTIPSTKTKLLLKENIGNLKLLLVVHQFKGNKVISVGPIWDYQESR